MRIGHEALPIRSKWLNCKIKIWLICILRANQMHNSMKDKESTPFQNYFLHRKLKGIVALNVPATKQGEIFVPKITLTSNFSIQTIMEAITLVIGQLFLIRLKWIEHSMLFSCQAQLDSNINKMLWCKKCVSFKTLQCLYFLLLFQCDNTLTIY